MKDDPTITRIRETRHRISVRCEHDPHKMIEYYLELQKKYREYLLTDEQEQARLVAITETTSLQLKTVEDAA